MKIKCEKCGNGFEVSDEDLKFYEDFDVPVASKCPECRLKRRLMERNARILYYRKCDFSGKRIISMYHENQPFPVYDQEIWWSDKWDAMDYGREFDFSRPFFEQFKELENVVPHFSVFVIGGTMENSDFTNCTGYLKNCYLICESDYDEDCYYSNRIYHSKNLIDCSNCYDCENSYECIDCRGCQNLKYCQECENCHDSYFLKNCIGCRDCVGCVNQRHKQYMIFNEQLTKEKYQERTREMNLNSHQGWKSVGDEAAKIFKATQRKNIEGDHNENVVGDHVYNSKNAYYCFDCKDLEDCRYCAKVASHVKNCMDYTSWGFKAERVYESAACGDNTYNLKFCSTCTTNISDLTYCVQCTGSSNLFGCVGFKKKQYCILNKQYTKEEYEKMVPRIIEHMKETGEWGEFFPMELCPFGYNEGLSMDKFPMTRREVLAAGYKWCDYEMPEAEVERKVGADKVPDTIADVPDKIVDWAIICEVSGKPFRITGGELDMYRRLDVPLPKRSYAVRHMDRMAKRPKYSLEKGECMKCGKGMDLNISENNSERVYCEQCYLKEVY